MASRAPVQPASRAWEQSTWICICCTGRCPAPNFPAWWPHLKNYALQGKSGPGAYPISMSARWKTFSRFPTEIAALRTRCLTVSTTAPSSAMSCRGASSISLPIMAYSPLGGDGNLVVGNRALQQVGTAHGCSAAAAALAWVIRSGNVIAIPESGSPAHVKENAQALSVSLVPQDLQILHSAFPGPSGAT